MAADDPRLIALAERVADGDSADWDVAAQGDPVLAASASQLQVISQIAALYRSIGDPLTDSAPAMPAPGTASRGPTDAELQSAKRFGTLYALERVGSGSFSEVYRAWDPNLRREVALKILNRAPSATSETASILGEGQHLAKIRHPNVMAVHGAEVIDGRVAIWSEFLHGRTLAEIVSRDGPLGPQEAAVVGDAVCRALSAVHHAGLLHRDIKAQNVMREAGGRIVLMDFGLGQEEGSAAWVGGHSVAGTPLYLAPEVFEHQPSTRSTDIYSAGVLVYYLVTGTFPVVGKNLEGLTAAHRGGQRRLLQEVRPDLPASFCQAVERAIRPDPADRYQSVAAFQQALARSVGVNDELDRPTPQALPAASLPPVRRTRPWLQPRVLGAAVVLISVLAGGAWWASRPAPVTDPPSVAVLPLRNTSGDPSKDYFADALTQEVIAKLWKLGAMRVIAPTSSMSFRDTGKGPREAGAELRVGAVVTGSVSWIGDRVRVVAALVDVANGTSLWSETYDRHIEDILDVQGDLSQQVAQALGAHISATDRASVRNSQPVDFDTYQLYLKGRYNLALRTEPAIELAITSFESATKRAPAYAPAYAGLANAYSVKWGLGFSPGSLAASREAGRSAAERAIELDNASAEAHLSLAFLQWGNIEWDDADVSFQRALAINPGDASAHHWYSLYLTCVGRMDEAVQHVQLAQQLDPINVRTNTAVGWVYYQARQYSRAEAQLKASLQIDPRMAAAHSALAVIYSLQDRDEEAIAEMTLAVEISKNDPEFTATLAYILAHAGRTAEARAMLVELTSPEPRVMAGSIAVIYSALGDVDRAFEWLDRSLENHDIWAAHLRVEPRLDGLRGDRRFDDYVRRLTQPAQKQARMERAGPDGR